MINRGGLDAGGSYDVVRQDILRCFADEAQSLLDLIFISLLLFAFDFADWLLVHQESCIENITTAISKSCFCLNYNYCFYFKNVMTIDDIVQ